MIFVFDDFSLDSERRELRRPRVHASYFQQKPNFLTGADLVPELVDLVLATLEEETP